MKPLGERLDLNFQVNVPVDGKKTTRSFSELIDGPTLVSVYMRNNTGSCDKQMISLEESFGAIRAKGYAVMGLSKDEFEREFFLLWRVCGVDLLGAALLGLGRNPIARILRTVCLANLITVIRGAGSGA